MNKYLYPSHFSKNILFLGSEKNTYQNGKVALQSRTVEWGELNYSMREEYSKNLIKYEAFAPLKRFCLYKVSYVCSSVLRSLCGHNALLTSFFSLYFCVSCKYSAWVFEKKPFSINLCSEFNLGENCCS